METNSGFRSTFNNRSRNIQTAILNTIEREDNCEQDN